ncbi:MULTISPECIES: Dabb family protein [unclassified Clostridium]
MIRHVCMFTLKDDNKEKNIADFFEKIEKLRDLDTIKNLT